jgi:hypothetical protein
VGALVVVEPGAAVSQLPGLFLQRVPGAPDRLRGTRQPN